MSHDVCRGLCFVTYWLGLLLPKFPPCISPTQFPSSEVWPVPSFRPLGCCWACCFVDSSVGLAFDLLCHRFVGWVAFDCCVVVSSAVLVSNQVCCRLAHLILVSAALLSFGPARHRLGRCRGRQNEEQLVGLRNEIRNENDPRLSSWLVLLTHHVDLPLLGPLWFLHPLRRRAHIPHERGGAPDGP